MCDIEPKDNIEENESKSFFDREKNRRYKNRRYCYIEETRELSYKIRNFLKPIITSYRKDYNLLELQSVLISEVIDLINEGIIGM